MIYDVRTYDIQPRKIAVYLQHFEHAALPVCERHGFRLKAYFVSQVGRLNQVVHIWEYDDMGAFERLRDARNRDPDWTAYLEKTDGLVVAQEDKLMGLANFSPVP
jgi:hypothetical protein